MTMKRWTVQSVGESHGEDDGDYMDNVIMAHDHEEAAVKAVSHQWYADAEDTLPDGMLVKVRPELMPGDPWMFFRVAGSESIDWRSWEDPQVHDNVT